jgi:dihydrofolate synthase / folylpolyglutamate synthase
MKFLCNRFSHPQNSFKSLHVAGSKGKGSVSVMLFSILRSYGISSGLYTSPHLLHFSERIAGPDGPFPDEIYGKAGDILERLVTSIIPETLPTHTDPSWFELVTLYAFLVFKEAALPWAVIETGLGGRLDATNVIDPEASILTAIELEHTEYLGDTLEKIAGEKAGIIKFGKPVFCSAQTQSVRDVFSSTASKNNAPIFFIDDVIQEMTHESTENGLKCTIDFKTVDGGAIFLRPLRFTLSLLTSVQAQNAALAAYTIKYLFPEITEEQIESGLSKAWLPARFEISTYCENEKKISVILDGAHTERSIGLVLETFKRIFTQKAHLLFACAADKNITGVIPSFSTIFSKITITRPGDKKESNLQGVAKEITDYFSNKSETEIKIEYDYEKAIQEALHYACSDNAPLLVIGSFYLVAEVKKIFSSQSQDQ